MDIIFVVNLTIQIKKNQPNKKTKKGNKKKKNGTSIPINLVRVHSFSFLVVQSID